MKTRITTRHLQCSCLKYGFVEIEIIVHRSERKITTWNTARCPVPVTDA